MDDTTPLFVMLEQLRQRGVISKRFYSALWRAARRGYIDVPQTVGAMRQALGEPGTPVLRAIPGLGQFGIQQLSNAFMEAERTVGEDTLEE